MGGKLSKQELHEALKNQSRQMHDDVHGREILSFLSPSDEDDALDLLANSFEDDPMFTWVAGLENNDPDKQSKMFALVRNMQAFVEETPLFVFSTQTSV